MDSEKNKPTQPRSISESLPQALKNIHEGTEPDSERADAVLEADLADDLADLQERRKDLSDATDAGHEIEPGLDQQLTDATITAEVALRDHQEQRSPQE